MALGRSASALLGTNEDDKLDDSLLVAILAAIVDHSTEQVKTSFE
jgi:hypothetical protein